MPPSNGIVLDRVLQSNMQPTEKSVVSQALANLTEPSSRGITAMSRPAGVVEFAMESVLATVTGGALGLLNAELKDGLDWNGKPLDGMMAAASGITGVIFQSKAAQEVSKQCLTVLSFRKTDAMMSLAKELSKKPSDPIEDAAKGV